MSAHFNGSFNEELYNAAPSMVTMEIAAKDIRLRLLRSLLLELIVFYMLNGSQLPKYEEEWGYILEL